MTVGQVRGRLPDGWRVELEPGSARAARLRPVRPDGVLVLTSPDGRQGSLVVDAVPRLEPRLVPVAAERLARARSRPDQGGMVVSGFLSPRTRERLVEARLSYADATGNLRLALDRPAVYLETGGADSDPWTTSGDRALRSLKGPSAGRIVRALCDFGPPFTVERLVSLSKTSLGSVARVFALLEREALIARLPRGPVTEVRWPELIRRWADDYSFMRSNTPHQFIDPRGATHLLGKLAQVTWPYAITGSLAGASRAPIAQPALSTVYVESPGLAAEALGLHATQRGANVLLIEPFDSVAFERTWVADGLRYAALSQVAVDLLTGPGRAPAEGEALLGWMREHKDAWRS